MSSRADVRFSNPGGRGGIGAVNDRLPKPKPDFFNHRPRLRPPNFIFENTLELFCEAAGDDHIK